MERSALHLAALASAAIPGLDPAVVELARQGEQQRYDVAFVVDTRERRWVIRSPRNIAAAAQLAAATRLLELLTRRLSVALPLPRGEASSKDGFALVYPYIPGHTVDLGELPPGPGLAAEIGRTLAHIHNVELEVCEEAGLLSYSADEHRDRRLGALDRASDTGHVPAGLLARWEPVLEDVQCWRFAPTLVHGRFGGERVIVAFDDEGDASTGRVTGITGWDECHVGDPADDLRAIEAECGDDTMETVLEAYSHARHERPDPHLMRRARLASEMWAVDELLIAHSAGDTRRVQTLAAMLRELENYLQWREDEPSEDDDPAERFDEETELDLDGDRAARSAARRAVRSGAIPTTDAVDLAQGEESGDEAMADETGEADEVDPGATHPHVAFRSSSADTTQRINPVEFEDDDDAAGETDRPEVIDTDDDTENDPADDDVVDPELGRGEGASTFVPVTPRRPGRD